MKNRRDGKKREERNSIEENGDVLKPSTRQMNHPETGGHAGKYPEL